MSFRYTWPCNFAFRASGWRGFGKLLAFFSVAIRGDVEVHDTVAQKPMCKFIKHHGAQVCSLEYALWVARSLLKSQRVAPLLQQNACASEVLEGHYAISPAFSRGEGVLQF